MFDDMFSVHSLTDPPRLVDITCIAPNIRVLCQLLLVALKQEYHNNPKFSDRLVWANSADSDQTAPRGAVWSESTLFAIASASFGCITLW